MDSCFGIYVHIPYCKRKCGYCGFVSSCDLSTAKLYATALKKEISAVAGDKLICDTIYIGGGTPSVLPRGIIAEIIGAIKNKFTLTKDAEITVEANPDSVDKEFIHECRESGINRISLGLQSDDDKLLLKSGRLHNYDAFIKSLAAIQDARFTNISVDLMLGLPGQTLAGAVKTAQNISSLPLTHISLYSLKIEEGTPFCEDGVSVDEDLQAQMYEECFNIFRRKGFNRYEVSNFSKAGFESRHNLKYWQLLPYYGFGVAAHSYVGGVRSENTSPLGEYLCGKTKANETKIPQSEKIEEYIMLSLRTAQGLNADFLKKEFGYDIFNQKAAEIKELVQINALKTNKNRISVCDNAFYILNSVILKLI